MKRLQIGVMGSAQDLEYTQDLERLAEEVGEQIAQAGAIMVFGAEKDLDSLSTAASRGAKRFGGLTMGITYGKGKGIYQKDADIIIVTGAERGGPREAILAYTCDALIAISGGSGTLNELVAAYQADIPMVALRNSGGWAGKMADQFFDARERRKVIGADTPQQAVQIAVLEGGAYLQRFGFEV